jgi:serine/threonine protein kinase
MQVMRRIVDDAWQITYPPYISPAGKDLISKLLERRPARRIGVASLLDDVQSFSSPKLLAPNMVTSRTIIALHCIACHSYSRTVTYMLSEQLLGCGEWGLCGIDLVCGNRPLVVMDA